MSAPTPAPVSSRDESYHTRHAPFGAFASFIIGLIAACGGFGQSPAALLSSNSPNAA
jgi:hypothetical protein